MSIIINKEFIDTKGNGNVREALYQAGELIREGGEVVISNYAVSELIQAHRIRTGQTRINVELTDENEFLVLLIEPAGETVLLDSKRIEPLLEALGDYADEGMQIDFSPSASAQFIAESFHDDLA